MSHPTPSGASSLRRLVPKIEARTPSASPTDEGSSASNKRRCISSACMPCRKRKSKCDGEKPACESCSIVYKTQCTYDIDSDHRRKGALKRDIRQLEEENEKRDIILDALRKASEADVDDIIQLVRSDESYDSIIETIKQMPIKPPPKTETSPTLEGALADFAGKPSLKKAGDNRHYGHTSNLALTGSDDELPMVAVDHIGTWTKVTNDVDLIKHLLSLYFTWSHPLYLLFSEEVFFYALNNKKLKWCSPMLVNACLALGCNYSDRPEARADPNDPPTVGDHFFAEAKRLLNEDDRSCLTTVQALGVMACRQAMMGQDSSGWKYAGQMMTMSIELGLHLTYTGNIQPSGKATDPEMEARRITFWGSYVVETVYAMAVGRISWLPRTAIQLEKPIPRENLEKKIWKPHGDPRFHGHEPTGLEQPACTYTVLVQSSRLTEIVNDTLQMFYAPRDRITSRKLEIHHERFIQWHNELPPSMAIKRDSPTLPQVIAMHIYYHNCVIHLFRPFLRVSFVHNTKGPHEICTDAAITIAQLMNLYSRTYGMRRAYFILVHCGMSAAIIHVVNISRPDPKAPQLHIQAAAYLTDIIRMMHEMYPTYPLMARYFKVIRGLVAKWVPVVPHNVRDALHVIDLPSPISSENGPALSPPDPSASTSYTTDFDGPSTPVVEINGKRKQSAPDLTQMTPNLENGKSRLTAAAREFLWTPFPESMDGMPVMPPERRSSNDTMDISRMLDSGVDGDWAQLNRDGFTMDARREFWAV